MSTYYSPHLLSLLIFLPILGALGVALLPRRFEGLQKRLGLVFSILTASVGIPLVAGFRPIAEIQFEESHAWLPSFGIRYHLGLDGLSLWLVVLTLLLVPLALLGSWRSVTRQVKEFNVLMLLLESAMLGVFCALDLFLFYVFWEAMLIPMYLLIGIWGHERRIYAAVKFFLFTMAGSVLMLVAFLVLYQVTGAKSLGILELARLAPTTVGPSLQMWLFAACAVAFAIKVPMFPFHTWLPDAHVEAPTAGSVLLAGVLLKMGAYGFLRIAIPFFPQAAHRFAPWIGVLAVIGIVYGALLSLVQSDLKKLVAYSSVSHLGFVMLGIAAFTTTSLVGSVYQMVNHGISTGALFFLVGMLYERRHTRAIAEFGGLKSVMPWFAAVFLLIGLSSMAVPGFNGFVGEFLILIGSWPSFPSLTAWAVLGVVLAAAYILWMLQRVLYGEVTHPENRELPDLSAREATVLAPLVVLALLLGLASPLVTRMIEPSAAVLWRQARASKPSVTAKPAQISTSAAPDTTSVRPTADPRGTAVRPAGDGR